ncbi:MAG TPA: hypothetical protein DF480_01805 [Clostridiales bacterium]|jgi:predicted hydrocarbon binding protein|nr:hypothetical protein [Clostridiales bacterium]
MFDVRKMQEQAILQAVQSASDEETAKMIVYGKDAAAAKEEDAAWVCSTMKRLEERFDPDAITEIRMNCQCGYGIDEKLTLVKELIRDSSCMEEFGNSERAQAAGMYCKEGELYLQFPFCPCPAVAGVDRFDTDTWCQCTKGYSKVLFEAAFGCKVDVELLQSIKMGDAFCLMKIIPQPAFDGIIPWKKDSNS